ncbi:MAG: hypothetical protein AAF170_16595 [Bacteroidota bacterium]
MASIETVAIENKDAASGFTIVNKDDAPEKAKVLTDAAVAKLREKVAKADG